MIVKLDKEVQERFNREELVIITERVDDVALLISKMIKMRLHDVLDRHIPRHARQKGLSWGWTAVIWLAYILTEGDHRKVEVQQYIKGMQNTLRDITGQAVELSDFDDDRLSHLLTHLSKKKVWHAVESDLNKTCIEVFNLPKEVVRYDPTTVSGYHEVRDEGLMQFGQSKDDPSLPQIKLAAASLDPAGIPLATQVVSGETADDGLYLRLIERVDESLNTPGLLMVGDCKMSALNTRMNIAAGGHFYLSPLPLTGKTPESMEKWIADGNIKDMEGTLIPVFRVNDRNKTSLAACGYEFEHVQTVVDDEGSIEWEERVLVLCSPAHAEKQAGGLERRLENAQCKIEALTPPRGRGKRQITKEETLIEAAGRILKEHKVTGLLDIQYEKETETKTSYVGRGRGSENREQKTEERVRYQITAVTRNEKEISVVKRNFGWKAFVTNAAKKELSLQDAVLCYRNEYRVERIFNRLKSRVNIAPLYVRRDDQIAGLTYLLTLGIRVLTLIEFVCRRSLKTDKESLQGLHPENRQKKTDKPTAERILKAFDGVTLTIVCSRAGNELMRFLTPLSDLQKEILKRLGLDACYRQIEIRDTGSGV